MVDIHSHILYGMDDGARDRDDSLAMLKIAADSGTTDIVATPHSDGRYRYKPEVVNDQIQDLNEATGDHPHIHRGCDFHLSIDNVQACLSAPRTYTINGLCYLMVEFADNLIPSSTEAIFQQFLEREVVPVITHPERNAMLQQSLPRLQQWIESGCLLQVTAQSLGDRFGRAARNAAWNWIRKGMVHAIASDAHDTEYRPPRLDFAHKLVAAKIGPDIADLLLIRNPGAIIAGAPVESMDEATIAAGARKWFQFWR